MNRLTRSVVATTGIAFLLMGGSVSLMGNTEGPSGHSFAEGKVHVGEEERGQTVRLRSDDILVISLESDRSAGFRWMVDELDVNVVRQLGRTKFREDARPEGPSVVQTLRFVGVNEGRAPLTLEYGRPWHKDHKPAKSYTIQVETEGVFHCY